MYQSLPPKSVLSHYPEAWNNPEDDAKAANQPLDNRPTTTHLCRAKMLDHEGFIRLDGIVVRRPKAPMPQPWASAGLLFAAGELLTEVPFDPNLDFLFDGEEVTFSARMWTHGWNIYSPSENIMYHYYYRTKAKRYWSLLPPDHALRLEKAKRRVQQTLQVWKKGTTELLIPENQSVDLGVYALGTERPIADWYKYANIDRVHWTVKFDAHCVR
jgi:UDP-GlcNAc:polypeptide alpha-N-acetylglucosaminyltransferase